MNEPIPVLPPRDPEGHKGTFGTVAVIGGQAAPPRLMLGAPAFAARAALRTGAGLAVLATPAPLLAHALTLAPGATGLALPIDADLAIDAAGAAEVLDSCLSGRLCLAVGPGLGVGPAQRRLVIRLLSREDHPLVLDADALNVLADAAELQRDFRAPAILTPHPGEFRRLADVFGLTAAPETDDERRTAATQLAQRLGAVVVLKGPRTVISDGQRTEINSTGGPALATAGSGDVLTGVIAALVAQFATGPGATALDLFEGARLGVYLHGRAADRWSAKHGDAGLTPEDLIAELPGALHEMRAG